MIQRKGVYGRKQDGKTKLKEDRKRERKREKEGELIDRVVLVKGNKGRNDGTPADGEKGKANGQKIKHQGDNEIEATEGEQKTNDDGTDDPGESTSVHQPHDRLGPRLARVHHVRIQLEDLLLRHREATRDQDDKAEDVPPKGIVEAPTDQDQTAQHHHRPTHQEIQSGH